MRKAMKAVDNGFRSLNLSPAHEMRSLRREISSRNTVAEAWIQTGEALKASMRQVKAN